MTSKPPIHRPLRWVAVLAILSLVGAAEVALRVTAYVRSHVRAPLSYAVSSGNYSRYDRDFGYVHPSDGEAFVSQIVNGAPVQGWRVYSDADGNSGRTRPPRRSAKRVFVFGDSFTAMQFRGRTWVHVLEEQLRREGRDVSFVNFGRGGYGILQMMDLAAAKVAKERPDLVLFAFIADDLERPRFWRVERDGRVLTLGVPEPELALKRGVDTYLVDNRVDESWFERAKEDPSEATLLSLNERFRALRGAYFRKKLYSFEEGLLLFRRFQPRPEMSYGEDPGVRRAIAVLEERSVPYAFLRLPTYPEIVAGAYEASHSQRARLRELQRLTRAPLVDMLAAAPVPEERAKPLFLFPQNGHPSEAGLRYYAETTRRRLDAIERAQHVLTKAAPP